MYVTFGLKKRWGFLEKTFNTIIDTHKQWTSMVV